MLADTTYQVYCSNLRKYRKKVKETQGFEDQKYWEKQLLRMEARILCGGRPLPEEKEESVVVPNNAVVTASPQLELSREAKSYLIAYKMAMKNGDVKAAERFKEVLQKLGIEVKDEGSSEPTSGNGNAA
jgi:hypothetical protein